MFRENKAAQARIRMRSYIICASAGWCIKRVNAPAVSGYSVLTNAGFMGQHFIVHEVAGGVKFAGRMTKDRGPKTNGTVLRHSSES